MNEILTEMQYEDFILETLEKNNGYRIRPNDKYNQAYAMDTEMLFEFLETTQKDEMETLRKIYKNDFEKMLINSINRQILDKNGNLISTLKNGIEINGHKLKFMYFETTTSYNQELTRKYEQNIFSVMKEVSISDQERIDVVLFLNGFAICAIELKCNFAGQSVEDAIKQFRTRRNPKNRMFLFEKGVLVSFAMDLNEVYMTTKLNGESTYFQPFNVGKGQGKNTGAGNPSYDDKFSVYYMWDDIFKKETILDLVTRYIYINKKEETNKITGEKKIKESLIFPRYHQIDCVRKLIADVKVNKTSQNYLIQHSAGSGKTNTIIWLAYRLSTLHDHNDKQIYDNVVVVTDRVVVNRQLQRALEQINHDEGKLKLIDKDSPSSVLKSALEGNTKIIATTIQRFPYIVDTIKKINNKTFAIIVDEAHSSTSGKDMGALQDSLGSYELDAEDALTEIMRKNGKRPNMSTFAFTATPKAMTLQMFGRKNAKGQYEAFHLYSMKQAIEERYILDVLENYTTYDTYYELNKTIEDDPLYKSREAKKKISHLVALEPNNVRQRVEIIIENFVNTIVQGMGGDAKAMVVTSSREEAIRYQEEFERYIKEKNYKNIRSLIAFSGTFKDKKTGKEYSESIINGFSESKTADKFDSDEYNVLIVANKYQTGFDQEKLCAMYILKSLRGVNAVQTLSRLNRVPDNPLLDKKTFVLDFVNKYDDIVNAFEPYFTTTTLTNSISPNDMYTLEDRIDGYCILDPDYIDNFYAYYLKITNDSSKKDDKTSETTLNYYLKNTQKNFDNRSIEEQRSIMSDFKKFVKIYEFIILATSFNDLEIYKKYLFISYLIAYLNISKDGAGFNLDDKIVANNFVQKKSREVKKSALTISTPLSLPKADGIFNEDEEEKLSKIIRDLNAKNQGSKYDESDAYSLILGYKDVMKADEFLRKTAKNNTLEDFELVYNDRSEDAIIKARDNHVDFCDSLLNDSESLQAITKLLAKDIYQTFLKEENESKKNPDDEDE